MNATAVRLRKEAHALFWPWGTVMMVAALPLITPYVLSGRLLGRVRLLEPIEILGFWAGLPLLATLTLGHEFQHRTLAVWLAQPLARLRLWSEKLLVALVAVLSASALFAAGYISDLVREAKEPRLFLFAGLYLLVTFASATFWTLTTRSIIGGLILNTSFQMTLVWILVCLVTWTVDFPGGLEFLAATIGLGPLISLVVAYAGLMFWLGSRKLARFQATGGAAGDDLLTSGPALMPESLAQWFRCRPETPILNLVRKEFRLLRPLWLLTPLPLLLLTWLAVRYLPHIEELGRGDDFTVNLLSGLTAIFFFLMMILAGSLSLGEERTMATHSWHMTLPLSVRTQWLVKLGVALGAAMLATVVLPLLVFLARGAAAGSLFLLWKHLPAAKEWLLMVTLFTFAAFWCACVVNGTVRAVLWVFPFIAAVLFSGVGGLALGQRLARSAGTLRDNVIAVFQLEPRMVGGAWFRNAELIALGAVIIFGVWQSYRIFRVQPSDNIWWMPRRMLPVALVSFLSVFCMGAGFLASSWHPFFEIRRALASLRPGISAPEISAEDLAQSADLSPLTRRWLAGSRLSFTPDRARPEAYFATVHLPSGLDCRVNVQTVRLPLLYQGVIIGGQPMTCSQRAR